MERQSKGLTLADGLLADLGGPRTAGLLARLEAAMEEAIADRLSFRRFLGLGIDDPGIDHATIALFRKRLHEAGLAGALFEIVNAHLRDKGLIVDEGTSVDATIIEAPRGKPRKNNKDQTSKDKAATHTKKHGQSHHGYKAHVASDPNAMIKDYRLDTAKVHDINHFKDLTEHEPDGGRVYADAAYRDTKRRKRLEGRDRQAVVRTHLDDARYLQATQKAALPLPRRIHRIQNRQQTLLPVTRSTERVNSYG